MFLTKIQPQFFQIFALGNSACCLAIVPYGGGRHIWALSAADIAAVFKITWVYSEVYATCVTLTKISILLFYERLFGRSWTTRGCMVLAFLFWVVNTVVFLAGCRPLSYYWDRYAYPDTLGAEGQGTCIRTLEYNLWIGACDVIIDALLLLVPIPHCKFAVWIILASPVDARNALLADLLRPIVYTLRITAKQRAGVLGIFMLGIM